MSITRWNPNRELNLMRRMMDRFFDDDYWQPMREMGSGENMLAIDLDEDDDTYTVTTSLPGVKAENINVQVHGDFLTIEGEIPEQVTEQKNGQRSLARERRYGRFTRSIRLPQPVKSDAADANYEDGVLRLTLPKAEEAKARSINVKSRS